MDEFRQRIENDAEINAAWRIKCRGGYNGTDPSAAIAAGQRRFIMPCPFPGMDPYIERPEIFPDFHDRLVTFICGALQPLLRPRYVALMQERLYVVSEDEVRRPDVSVVERTKQIQPHAGAAVLEVDSRVVFEVVREEVREPRIEIIEPAAGNRVVTAIEVLSPSNKRPGAGRTSYLAKRDQFEAGEINLVEIDLLRAGQPTIPLKPADLDSLQPWRYLVSVWRPPTRYEIYAVPLERRLPKVAVPLAYGDNDIPLDIQGAFARTWDEGPYPEILRYGGAPPGELADAELRWCREQLVKAGYAQTS